MKILIVNRGEIAKRIAFAIKELGHTAVGLYTEKEKNAVHLGFCDQWIALEGNSLQETYLNISQIVAKALAHGIEAVHPGYGFLAENDEFARAVEKAGLIFIGPKSETIELMGDKGRAKEVAKAAGLPLVPGGLKEIQTVEELKEMAQQIGYPVLLKAVSGGGGKGMRRADNEEELVKSFEVTKREALNSFGDDGIILEKYIVSPHHIEVQIFGDGQGGAVHFFERECSIQRRHQKIIEEAPSPFIGEDQNLRNKICKYAVDLAKYVKYSQAGTVEFIVDAHKNIYFLEMNTRIQVEHPITELITGYDLLVLMIEFALNPSSVNLKQEKINRVGHAIECRICAEDSLKMLPSTGVVSAFSFELLPHVRFDHCMQEGMEVLPFFDNMLGKLIAHSPTRLEVLRKIQYALKSLQIQGVKTNVNLHRNIIRHPQFVDGIYDTSFLEKNSAQQLATASAAAVSAASPLSSEDDLLNSLCEIIAVQETSIMENT